MFSKCIHSLQKQPQIDTPGVNDASCGNDNTKKKNVLKEI